MSFLSDLFPRIYCLRQTEKEVMNNYGRKEGKKEGRKKGMEGGKEGGRRE